MNKQYILDLAKKDMASIIRHMELPDVIEKRRVINRYFDLLDTLIDLEDNVRQNEEENPDDNLQTEGDGTYQATEPVTANENVENVFRFERKLRGGILPAIRGAYVPEVVIRKLGIEHGDFLRAEPFYMDGQTRYHYELVRKGSGEVPDRIEKQYCLVEKDGDMFVVSKSLAYGGEFIKLNEAPHSFLLREEDIAEYDINENDIVDIAYSRSNPHYHRIVWKYPTTSSIKTSPKNLKQPKEYPDLDDDQDNIEETEGAEVLNNKSVLVVGCEPRKAIYKKHIEDRGGKFLWAQGMEGRDRLFGLVQKADIAIILIRFIRHQASNDVVALCKQNNVLYAVVDGLGVKALMMGAIEKLRSG